MNNLINKAIQAIKDGKNDYAIGLLEGILEMNSQDGTLASVPAMTHISSNTAIPLATFQTGIVASGAKDEGAMLDKVAAAKLDEIKRVANIQVI